MLALRWSVAEAALRPSRCATPPSPSGEAQITPTGGLKQRAVHDVIDPHHPQKTTCATGGAHVGARARGAHSFGAERVARGSDPAAAGARVRSAHAIGAERVARGDAGSQCALAGLPPTATPTRTPAQLGGSCLLAHRSSMQNNDHDTARICST